MLRLLVAVLLAVLLASSLGAFSIPNLFSSPTFSTFHTGFSQVSPSEIGSTPILFAPRQADLLNGNMLNGHIKDRSIKPTLMTSNWTSSMKTSPVNEMFAMMAMGIGGKSMYG
jgi:hypothetical protein